MSTRAPHKLLTLAARVLEARYRVPMANFLDEHGTRYHARLAWPGVVVVTLADDGTELARSLPGRPTDPSNVAPLRPAS